MFTNTPTGTKRQRSGGAVRQTRSDASGAVTTRRGRAASGASETSDVPRPTATQTWAAERGRPRLRQGLNERQRSLRSASKSTVASKRESDNESDRASRNSDQDEQDETQSDTDYAEEEAMFAMLQAKQVPSQDRIARSGRGGSSGGWIWGYAKERMQRSALSALHHVATVFEALQQLFLNVRFLALVFLFLAVYMYYLWTPTTTTPLLIAPSNEKELVKRLLSMERQLAEYAATTSRLEKEQKSATSATSRDRKQLEELTDDLQSIYSQLGYLSKLEDKFQSELSGIKDHDKGLSSVTHDLESRISNQIELFESTKRNLESSVAEQQASMNSYQSLNDEAFRLLSESVDTLTSQLNDWHAQKISNIVMNELQKQLPSHLVFSKDPETDKLEISPEFWHMLQNRMTDIQFSWDNFLQQNENSLGSFINSYLEEKRNSVGDRDVTKEQFMDLMNENFSNMREELDDRFMLLQHSLDQKQTFNSSNLAATESVLDRQLQDYALYSSGARVNPFVTSPTFVSRPKSFFSRFLSFTFGGSGTVYGQRPLVALTADTSSGMCWAFPGSQGQIGVRLSQSIFISDFTIEHSSARGLNMSTAPKDVELWVSVPDQANANAMRRAANIKQPQGTAPADTYVRIARSSFNRAGPGRQTFPIPLAVRRFNIPAEDIVVRVLTNWGSQDYTCLYRVSVHGQAADLDSVEDDESIDTPIGGDERI